MFCVKSKKKKKTQVKYRYLKILLKYSNRVFVFPTSKYMCMNKRETAVTAKQARNRAQEK